MRDVSAERQIERRLSVLFDVDVGKIDVTVSNREATISGFLRKKTRREAFTHFEYLTIKRHFSPDRIPGVDRYYFQFANEPTPS